MIDDPDPFQHPAPLKLCHQLTEDVKRLKVLYIPLYCDIFLSIQTNFIKFVK